MGSTAGPALFPEENRQRLSGPGLRAFERIADRWELSLRERLLVLGSPTVSTYQYWVATTVAHGDLKLSVDALTRISAVLGIYVRLSMILQDAGREMSWLQTPYPGAVFNGRAPMECLTDGSLAGVMSVRDLLSDLIP